MMSVSRYMDDAQTSDIKTRMSPFKKIMTIAAVNRFSKFFFVKENLTISHNIWHEVEKSNEVENFER